MLPMQQQRAPLETTVHEPPRANLEPTNSELTNFDSGRALRGALGDLAFPLALDVRARDADADLLLELEDEHAVVGDAGDLADQAATRDDLVALAELLSSA